MNKTQILEFLNANPICHLATAEGDQPRVRGMMMYQADENGIIFHTGDFKELYRQLTKNSKVEICFNAPDMSKQIRICGSCGISGRFKTQERNRRETSFHGALGQRARLRQAYCVSSDSLQSRNLVDGDEFRAYDL